MGTEARFDFAGDDFFFETTGVGCAVLGLSLFGAVLGRVLFATASGVIEVILGGLILNVLASVCFSRLMRNWI